MRKKVEKLVLINLLLAAGMIFAFSRVGLNLSLWGNTLQLAGALTVLILGAVLFFYLNGRVLFARERPGLLEDKELAAQRVELKKLEAILPFASGEIRVAQRLLERFRGKEQALFRVAALNGNRGMKFLLATNYDAKVTLVELLRLMVRRLTILDATDEQRYRENNAFQIRDILDRMRALLDQYDVFLEEVSKMGAHLNVNDKKLLSSIEVLRTLRQETEDPFAAEAEPPTREEAVTVTIEENKGA